MGLIVIGWRILSVVFWAALLAFSISPAIYYFEWLNIEITLLLCAGVGLLFGGELVYEAKKEKAARIAQ